MKRENNTFVKVLEKIKKISRNKKIVFVSGTFDLLHVGHIRFLQKAKSYGDVLLVGISSNDTVKRFKDAARPIIPEKQRLEVVNSIKDVDYAFITPNIKKSELIKKIVPDVAVINLSGLSEKRVKKIKEMSKKLKHEMSSLKIIFLKKGYDISTTKIIKKIFSTQSKSL